MKKTDFNIEISLDNVLRGMCVFEDNELYEEVRDELITLIPIAKEKIKPVALLEAGTLGEHKLVRNDHTCGDYCVDTKEKLVEILYFRHFAKHFTFTSEGKNSRNKHLKNYFDVSVVIDIGCGNTNEK